ncbi:MAG: recombinase family protein [Cyanobacteria bacterium SID2]|nr:recombinase family protein [Cyanobacteria bacterium SID2]
MHFESVWIVGSSRSGKTGQLVDRLCRWQAQTPHQGTALPQPTVLVLAANGDNRIVLSDRIAAATAGESSVYATTPLGFFENEVLLFWPLLVETLNLKGRFPLRLRPETEQMLATKLWQPDLDDGQLQQLGIAVDRWVRRTLDLLQLAGAAGIAPEEIPERLARGLPMEPDALPLWQYQGALLLRWRQWCWEWGLLTYGIVFELYWRYLLPHPNYQRQLTQRFAAVFADDADEYPAVAKLLFETLLDRGLPGTFTFNPEGGIRLGLNADPDTMADLAERCRVETLTGRQGLAATLGHSIVKLALEPTYFTQLPSREVECVQTVSRAHLLRRVGDAIVEAVNAKTLEPQEIAVIVPGLDAIARYTLTRILEDRGVPARSLNVQRPLVSSPHVRAVLTLLALVYPGLGRTIDRNAVAEMLVTLSEKFADPPKHPSIDPVRAGAMVDVCYQPHPEAPHLLPIATFDRWDRLGYRATDAYERIRNWSETAREQLAQRTIASPVSAIDSIVREFLWRRDLPDEQLEALRELLETAQHFWEVEKRVRWKPNDDTTALYEFIALLQRGTVAANPYPLRHLSRPAVLLSNIYQYRTSRLCHRWHFWLDISSPLWMSGGSAVLFGAPLFLRSRPTIRYTEADAQQADEERLERILYDLLARVEERVVLGYSELAINGQEQTGLLLSLANAAVEAL